MKKITEKFLQKNNPCEEGYKWWIDNNKPYEAIFTLKNLITDNHNDWANWLIVRVTTHDQRIKYAIFAAEQVIAIYEKQYPKDDRPRKAIRAAKQYLKNKTHKNRSAARSAWRAAWSARSAAESAAWSAWSAGSAAWSARSAAESAAESAAWRAAESAAWSARSAAESARSAAESAAESAERAAESAAWSARSAAERAAESAAWSAGSAWSAARSAMQIKILNYGIKILRKP